MNVWIEVGRVKKYFYSKNNKPFLLNNGLNPKKKINIIETCSFILEFVEVLSLF